MSAEPQHLPVSVWLHTTHLSTIPSIFLILHTLYPFFHYTHQALCISFKTIKSLQVFQKSISSIYIWLLLVKSKRLDLLLKQWVWLCQSITNKFILPFHFDDAIKEDIVCVFIFVILGCQSNMANWMYLSTSTAERYDDRKILEASYCS